MTRMEMWKDYRDEIAKNTKLGYAIVQDSQNIEKYRKEIDKINPAILSSIKSKDLSFVKGVSDVKVSQNQISSDIVKMFNDINKAKTSLNYNKVAATLDSLNNLSILDKDKKLKEAWLLKDENYEQLLKYVHESQLELQDDKEIETSLQTKYNDFSSKEEVTVVSNITSLSKPDDSKQIGQRVFTISAAFAIFALIILVVLVILKVVLV